MRKKLVVAAAAVAVVLGLGTPSVQAGAPELTVTGDLAPGGTITVSGDECMSTEPNGPGEVQVQVAGGDPSATVGSASGPTNDDGTWSFDITIAESAQPGGTYVVGAGCEWYSIGEPVSFTYQTFTFVMGEAVATTSTTAGSTSTTAGATTTAAPSATAAAAPRYTG